MGDDYGPLMFAVANPDGTYSECKEVSALELQCDDAPFLPDTTTCLHRRPWQQGWHGEIRIENPEALRNVLGDAPIGTTKSICWESHDRVWHYRHAFVWQYRRERKGNRANRKKRGHWETVKRNVMIPNAAVTGIRQEFSDRAEFPTTTVEFEVRP